MSYCNHDYDQGGCTICQDREARNYEIRLRNEERDRWSGGGTSSPEPRRKTCSCIFELEAYWRPGLENRYCQLSQYDTPDDERWVLQRAFEAYKSGALKVGSKLDILCGGSKICVTMLKPFPAGLKVERTDTKHGEPTPGHSDWYTAELVQDEAEAWIKGAKLAYSGHLQKGYESQEYRGYYSTYRVSLT